MVKTLPLMDALRTLNLPGLERNLFTSAPWLKVIDETYRLKMFVKYIEKDKRIVSYIIYSAVRNFLEHKICICSYCDYFDCYIDKPSDWDLFFKSLRQEYPGYRIAIRNLRDLTVRQSPHFKLLSKEWFHLLDVRADLDTIWKKTHDSFRSAVKQSQKTGVMIRRCDKKDLPSFYNLHLNVRKNKYRLFPQPYRFFEIIWQHYMDRGQGLLLGAFDPNGKMVGANFYLICENTLYYKFNTSDLKLLKYRPNNLLFWEGIKFAKERGLEFIDLGSSGLDQAGLIQYKDHMGATRMEIQHYGFAPENYKFSQKKILRFLTSFFTQRWMPNMLLKMGSHLIYPYLA